MAILLSSSSLKAKSSLLTLSLYAFALLSYTNAVAISNIPRAPYNTSFVQTPLINSAQKAPPSQSQLVQFQPCTSTKASIPIIVTKGFFKSSQATSLYIVTHGASADPESYFTYINSIVGTKSIVVSPGFYQTDDATSPRTYYQPSQNLAWDSHTNAYNSGDDAIFPSSSRCSSFDVYDSLLDHFNDKKIFPNLKKVFFVGHSGGSNTISRYSQFIRDALYPFKFRFILANASNQAYFTDARPQEANSCKEAFNWPYELKQGGMNRYIASRYVNSNEIFTSWIQKDIVTLIGNLDTISDSPDGTQTCSSQAQGGMNRRDRNYAWWAYINILSGRSDQVKTYYGYNQLIKSGASQMSPSTSFRHRNCIVKGVGHNAPRMFNSACGLAALTRDTMPKGADP